MCMCLMRLMLNIHFLYSVILFVFMNIHANHMYVHVSYTFWNHVCGSLVFAMLFAL